MTKMARLAAITGFVGLSLGVWLVGATAPARALTTDDKPAAILIWPKIVVDTSGVFGAPTDTVVQLSNVSNGPTRAHCFYVNANSHCAAPSTVPAGTVCEAATDCPVGTSGTFAPCVPGWSETDFDIVLTRQQPLGWDASSGLSNSDLPLRTPGVCAEDGVTPCSNNNTCTCLLNPNGSNVGTGIPPSPENPFVGSLTCIEFSVGTSPAPDTSSNALKGEATIETSAVGAIPTLQKYNAVGLRGNGSPLAEPGVLQLGGASGGEYDACPTTLILDHAFDNANFGPGLGTVDTDLTLVPCGNDFLRQVPGRVTAQFLVFNEFEQRFSASRTVDCFLETPLSNIDTPVSSRSIFNFAVMGTIVGQTRIRGVADPNTTTGRGLVGVARIFLDDTGAAAYNLFQVGTPDFSTTPPDVITIP